MCSVLPPKQTISYSNPFRKSWHHEIVLLSLTTHAFGGKPVVASVSEAQRRHAVHYKNILDSANQLYLRGGPITLHGLALLDTEMENVRTASTWCAKNSERDRSACLMSAEFAFVGAYILEARLHPRVYLSWLEDATSAARRSGNRRYEAAHLTNTALCYIALSQASRAVPLLEQALLISREIHDRWGESVVMNVWAALSVV